MRAVPMKLTMIAVAFLYLMAGHALALDTGLIGKLTSSLGVTESQASGGAGSIFNYAKGNMSADDFTQVANAVPGIDSMMSSAPAAESSGGLAASAASMMGGGAGSLGGLSSLAGSFSKLGMSSDMVGKFVPVVLDYVQSSGGDSVMKLLQGALM